MKKNISIFLFLALIAFLGFAFNDSPIAAENASEEVGIEFYKGTWEEALAKAKKEKKYIFVDAYAAWCGPCKIIAKRYFTKATVGDYYNANFINYKMDMEKHKDGPRLARKWGLQAYPTLYFIKSDESIVKTSVGLIDDKALLKIAAEIKAP